MNSEISFLHNLLTDLPYSMEELRILYPYRHAYRQFNHSGGDKKTNLM